MRVVTILLVFVTVSSVYALEPKRKLLENGITRNKRDTVNSSCDLLYEEYKNYRGSDKTIKMLFHEKPERIHVMSTYRASSRALAALLAVAIRYAAGYEDVSTWIDNRTMYQLAVDTQPFSTKQEFTDDIIYIHVDADLEEPQLGKPLLHNCTSDKNTCSIAGPRLMAIGRTPSVNLHVYSVLSKKSLNNTKCTGANTWSFYQNTTTIQECDFQFSNLYNKKTRSDCFPIYTMEDITNSTHTGNFRNELDSFLSNVQVCEIFINNRTELNALLEDVDVSFVFIDYELGYEKIDRHVEVVQLPPKSSTAEPTVAMRVADHLIIRHFAPNIENILNWMRPQPEDLREVLNTDAVLEDINESACRWANENPAKFRAWTNEIKKETLIFPVILCENSDLDEYKKLIDTLDDSLNEILKDDIKLFNIIVGRSIKKCTNDNVVAQRLKELENYSEWRKIAGVAVPRSVISNSSNLQVVFYDIPPPKTTLHDGISISFGSLQQLTNSVRYFLKKQGWSRVGIISEKSALAENITSDLGRKINYKQEIIDGQSIAQALLNLKNASAKVIYINAEPAVANLIICEAEKLGMVTDDDEYAWIAREWRPSAECHHRIQVFTISYWWSGVNETFIKDFGGNSKIREKIKEKMWRDTSWPILAEPIIDAVLLMVYRVQMMLDNNPERIFDLHTSTATKLMEDQSNGKEIASGVVHKIHQIQNMQYNPFVYVTSWRGNVSNLVAIWRIKNDTIEETNTIYEPYYGGKRPSDGKTQCITTTSGDKFTPFCHDPIWLCVVAVLLILPVIVWKTRQCILLKFKRQERETLMRLLSRCEKTAAVLEPYLVNRSALELREELGSGHFGRVRFGMLRASNHPTMPIAAKTLRENAAPAEEAEFLREASTLATLTHDHIIRLVGVCADADGPPLLLMDHAFFGDLLKYLRQRRHLVEIYERNSRASDVSFEEKALKESLDPESRHVSPEELTRLAREAAQALDHLSGKHILHRDVRAANCLIDARRVLKLADFGMARSVDVKAKCPLDDPNKPDDYKYICCRRGVFPVPWMAPESLERGEFSRASDVWALGVLVLEIATLGARPYGSWSPVQVFRYVRSGGRPPLPRDASYHTCEVTEMCWTELPAKRATAKEVVDYLAERPTALRGAWRPAWPEPTEIPDGSDSGFSDRATEQDWPKGDDLRVSTL